jgi:hypothetical protein
MVLRDRPERLAISRMDSCSRNAHLLMTLSVATSITPVTPAAKHSRLGFLRGSDLRGNHPTYWLTSRWKSTAIALDDPIERIDDLGILLLRQRGGTLQYAARDKPAAPRTASEFFCQHVLDRGVLQRQIGVHPLEPGVLSLQLSHARQVRHRRARVLALPRVIRR